MATIPTIESATVRAIDAARESGHVQWDSIGLGMSELGSECDRALWYAFRWATQEKLTAKKLRIFESGHEYERRLIADLRRIDGVEVRDVDQETGKQLKCYAIGGHVRGKLDGEVLGVPEAPKRIHVLECKSHNDKSFKDLIKKKLKAAKLGHWLQCQMYCHMRGLTRCLYLAANKNDDEIYSERIEYDAVECLKLLARLENIILQPIAPSRIKDKPDAWPCILCRQKAVCHREDFGRNHCRSCIHATPIVDHDSTDATWLCEKFGRTLSVDEQRAGCPAHLFLPDFVPGKQEDAGDDFVAYVMADGSTWTDREQSIPARYWHHAESGTAFESPTDPGNCEELTAAEFAEASAYYAGK